MRELLEGLRDPDLVRGLAARIRVLAAGRTEPLTFMEVCGTHTMAIHQHGLRSLLPPQVRLISGPGCPVCVTPVGYLDRAVACARLPRTLVATFGDMMRVPGSSSTLARERALGGDVRVVYSPLDALALAERNPGSRVVFLAVGFETTAPTVAGTLLQAQARSVRNLFALTAHKTVPPALEALSRDEELRIDGYLCPAHVSAVIGADAYRPLAQAHGVPCVVTGFEPADILQGVAMLLEQATQGRSAVEIQYRRFVTPEGNPTARRLLARVFRTADAGWRGLGQIPGSGLELSAEFAPFDAGGFVPEPEEAREPPGCRCGDVLKGKLAPPECPLFGTLCTPEEPVGACMVSSEGSCAAAFRFGEHA